MVTYRMFRRILITQAFCIVSVLYCHGQAPLADSSLSGGVLTVSDNKASGNKQYYDIGRGRIAEYEKPGNFSFIKNLPKDFAGIATSAFSRKSVGPWLLVAGSTAFLLLTDESINNGVRNFSNRMNLDYEQSYNNLVTFKLGNEEVKLLRAPQNLNTAFYQLGQGFPGLLIGAGLFTYGKIKKDYRSVSTSAQLAEAFILMGVSTQIIKRITGRQSPGEATKKGGEWNFFPSFKEYQQNTPYYDAFPSGHLATMMSTVTILDLNYPEKRWIKPVGYSLIGLVGVSMVNNRVHWASDYPLAIGLGYLCARQVAKNHRKITSPGTAHNRKASMNYFFNYVNGTFVPGVLVTF